MHEYIEVPTRKNLLEEVKDALEETSRGVGRCIAIAGDIGMGKTSILKKIDEIGKEMGFMVAYGQCTSQNEIYAPLLGAFSDITYDDLIGVEKHSGFEHIFLIEKSGKLVSHSTSLSSWQLDEDIISGMLTAIQDFATTSFSLSEDDARLGTLDFKDTKIIIEYGKNFFIAGVVRGDEHESMRRDLSTILNDFEKKMGGKKWHGEKIVMPDIEGMMQMTIAKKYRSVTELEGTSLADEQRKIRTRFIENISALTLKRPLLILIDDFHRVDGPSSGILAEIAKITKENRICLIVACTPDEVCAPASHTIESMIKNPNFIGLKVPPLTLDESAEIINKEMGDTSEKVIKKIYEISRGNPYIIEEIVENIKMSKTKNDAEIISTIEDIRTDPEEIFFDRKMEVLEEEEMFILEYCAVADMPVSREFLERCLEIHGIGPMIKSLVDRGFLEKVDGNYKIRHKRIRDKMYNTLPKRWKRIMHGKVGLILEEMRFERPNILASRLAKHFTEAKVPSKAMQYLISASDFAMSTYSIKEAMSFLQDAEKMIDATGHTKENLEKRARIKEGLGDIYSIESNYAKAADYYNDASECYGNITDKARCMRKLSMINMKLGRIDDAMRILSAEERMLRGRDNHELGRAYLLKGNLYWMIGKYEDAVFYCTKAITQLKKEGLQKSDTADALYLVGSIYFSQKKLNKALSAYSDALKMLSDINNYSGMAKVSHAVGKVYFLLREYKKSEDWYSAALTLAKRMGDSHKIAEIYSSMADLYSEKDELEKAEYYLTKSEQIFTNIGIKEGKAHIHRIKGKMYREKGKLKKAKDELVKSVEMYMNLKMPLEQAESLTELGLTLIEMSEKDGLLALKEAKKIFKSLGKKDSVELIDSILKSFK